MRVTFKQNYLETQLPQFNFVGDFTYFVTSAELKNYSVYFTGYDLVKCREDYIMSKVVQRKLNLPSKLFYIMLIITKLTKITSITWLVKKMYLDRYRGTGIYNTQFDVIDKGKPCAIVKIKKSIGKMEQSFKSNMVKNYIKHEAKTILTDIVSFDRHTLCKYKLEKIS